MAQCGGIDMSKLKIRAVLVGLGNQAIEHLIASIDHQEVQIVAGVDLEMARHQQIKQDFADLDLRFFQTLDELQASGLDFDALILALPHDVYEKEWDNIVQFGKPLLKEKPLGRDYQEAKTFMDKACQAGCGLQTAIQRRHYPSYQYLSKYLRSKSIEINELHAHLHLGKGQQQPVNEPDLKWRNSRQRSGGGALLDAGYHLVDLVQYIIGDFEVISATMWNGAKADNGMDIEDRCWLTGCTTDIWLMLDTWVQGEPNATGGFKKSEMIVLNTNQGVICANREGIWHNDTLLFKSSREWEGAMRMQLSEFAQNIHQNNWQNDAIWDQLPAMRTIDKAYWLSKSY